MRGRLTRRGLASPAVVLSLETAIVRPIVPPVLMKSTVTAAMKVAAGQALAAGTVSVGAASLSKGVLTTMKITSMKWAAGLLLALSIAGGGAGVAASRGGGSVGEPRDQTLDDLIKKLQEAERKIEGLKRHEGELNAKIERLEGGVANAENNRRRQGQAPFAGGPGLGAPGGGGGGGGGMGGTLMGGMGGAGAGPIGGGGLGGGAGVGPIGGGGLGGGGGAGPMGGGGGFGGGPGGFGPAGMPGMGGFGGGGSGRAGGRQSGYLDTGSILVSTKLQDGKLAAYSVNTGAWKTYKVPVGVESATPVTNPTVVALMMNGPNVTQIAAFDQKSGEWSTHDLSEPTTKAEPIVGPGLAAYAIGRHAYAYSAEAHRWGVLELEEGAKAQVALGAHWATVNHDGRLHVFSAKTGTWSSTDSKTSR